MEYKHRLMSEAISAFTKKGWGCRNSDFYQIHWDPWVPEELKPTLEQIKEKISELEAQEAATRYQKERAASYAKIGEQLDMIYWDQINQTQTWIDHISSVKDSFPKPE